MSDLFRFGKISKVYYEDGMVDVTYNDRTDAVTKEVRLLLHEYNAPDVDDPVFVMHMPNGRTAALCLGRYWFADWKPIEGFKGLFRKCFSRDQEKCYIKYTDPDNDDGNGNDGTLLLHNDEKTRSEAKSHERESEEETHDKAQRILIESDTTAEIKAGTTLTLTGEGKVLIQGGIVEITGDSAVSIDGGTVNITGDAGDVKVRGISLVNHTHVWAGANAGGPVGGVTNPPN